MIAKVERGERRCSVAASGEPAPPSIVLCACQRVFRWVGHAWSDGENVDLHRSSVREKCIEELEEALIWLDKSTSNRPPEAETTTQHKGRREHLLQVMDAAEACYMYIGVQCEAYGFSMLEIWKEHYNKLRSLCRVTGWLLNEHIIRGQGISWRCRRRIELID